MNQAQRARLSLIISMVIFGTIGLFRRFLPLPSSLIAFVRAAIGSLCLLAMLFAQKKHIAWDRVKANLLPLCLSGILLGFNWIILFEAYQLTSVATANLCYYMAPSILVIASAVLFRDRISFIKWVCVILSLVGMILVSGVLGQGIQSPSEIKGVLLGLLSAVFYAVIVLLNKSFVGFPATDRTLLQLAITAVVLLPYVLLTEDVSSLVFTPKAIGILLFVGIVHTGIAYALCFGAIIHLPVSTAATLSYLDPVVSIFCSALILKEPLGLAGIIGAILIIGSALVSELAPAPKNTVSEKGSS